MMKRSFQPGHVLAILLALVGLTSTASAEMFDWTYSVEDYVVVGAFSTSVASGNITEEDVTAHVFTVSQSGSVLFTVDLVGGTLNGVALGVNDQIEHDFEYVIGNTSFESVNSDGEDSNVPVVFNAYMNEDVEFGIAWITDISPPSWEVFGADIPSGNNSFEASTEGFASGPVVAAAATPIPEPSSMAMFGIGALGLFGYSRRRRQTSAAA